MCTCILLDDDDTMLPSMSDITVEDFIAELSEHNLLDREILKALDTIREAMIDEVCENAFNMLPCAVLCFYV